MLRSPQSPFQPIPICPAPLPEGSVLSTSGSFIRNPSITRGNTNIWSVSSPESNVSVPDTDGGGCLWQFRKELWSACLWSTIRGFTSRVASLRLSSCVCAIPARVCSPYLLVFPAFLTQRGRPTTFLNLHRCGTAASDRTAVRCPLCRRSMDHLHHRPQARRHRRPQVPLKNHPHHRSQARHRRRPQARRLCPPQTPL